MSKVIEICCFSINSVINAQICNVDRIELCDNITEGGTTPSFGMIRKAREIFKNKINVIVRPRGGNFVYSDTEFEIIKEDILEIKKLDIDGIVVGILNNKNEIDIPRMEELINLSRPLSLTFHKAFDETNDPFKSMEELIELGIDRILTSGQKETAIEGSDLLSELINKSNNRIIIMPGGSINENNVLEINNITNAKEFHSSAKKLVRNNTNDQEYFEADTEKILNMKNILS